MARPRSLTVIASLALAQGIVEALVGLLWLQIVSIFDQESGAMSSLIVMIAEVKGWVLIFLSLLYLLFAVGAWKTRPWAWWIGLLVSVINLMLMAIIILKGGSVVAAVIGLIVPVVMMGYLLSETGWQVFGRDGGPSRPLH